VSGREIVEVGVSSKIIETSNCYKAACSPTENVFKDLNDIAEVVLAQSITFEDLSSSGLLERNGTEQTVESLQEIVESKRR
jgi:predicted RNA binding protein with dsRBD fold (UPF0201 family)